MTPSLDEQGRIDALDPARSFIVEAPAGSGKTELLIQRYLRLLGLVEQPEQIVAITFTRKAAAEMRQRVIDSLRAAARDDPEVPAYRKKTVALAQDVLAHASQRGWSLIDQPRRLRIMTIDSLNTGLAQQLPLLSNGVVSLGVADDSHRLYALAARRTTESLADSGPLGRALQALLAGAGNSLAQLERWLAGTLVQRDRWLRELSETGSESLADNASSSLARLLSERLAALRQLVGPHNEQRLFELLGKRVTTDAPELDAAWRAAAALLLTKKGNWRRRFTRSDGFPTTDKARRAALNSVLGDLHASKGLRERLGALHALPESSQSRTQREALLALELVLPRLLAELRILFEAHASVDHTELALAAQQALGTVEEPSELLLALDRRVEHILVDEFQDTSHLQWRLLELLTAGWESGDGRTLFLVGDPMQSIYRFRDADLSLFLEAQQRGLGHVELHPVALQENHRSAREIVDWINDAFAAVFPVDAAIEGGMPGFRPACSRREADDGVGVELHILQRAGYEAEIARVIEVLEQELSTDPSRSIGILVRSRSHLAGMRTALKAAGLSAHAVEIDSLADTQLGQDLIGLTSALVHKGDRLGWLGLLRSPWCGLDWQDLLALCPDESQATVWEHLCDSESLARLSAQGRERTEWLSERLQRAYALRPTRSFGRWVRDCWLMIDGPATLADATELELAEHYFSDLGSLARHGDIDDPAALRAHFSEPVAGTDVPTQSGVEILTMHRAKGLEFDTVILPGLGRVTRGNSNKLLLCQEINLSDGDRISLLAAATEGKDPIFEYLKAEERQRDAAERGRLLYVAATRAKSRLHLIGSVEDASGKPRSGSLLATLWPGLGENPEIQPVARNVVQEGASFIDGSLRCLRFDAEIPQPAVTADAAAGPVSRPEFEWVTPASVHVGTLIHRELQRLADAADREGRALPPTIDIHCYQRELALLGVENEDLTAAAQRVADALETVWADPVGRWILKPWNEAWSELRLTIRDGDRLEHLQLDRSFIDDDGRRWIIDYKTGRHFGGDVDRFLDTEVERYRDQVERYARAIAETDVRPIRVGLYFPLMKQLRDWEPSSRGDSR